MIRRRKSERNVPDETELRLQARLANLDALRPRLETPGDGGRLQWPGAPKLAQNEPREEPAESEYGPGNEVGDGDDEEFDPESSVDGDVRESLEVVAEVDMDADAEAAGAAAADGGDAEVDIDMPNERERAERAAGDGWGSPRVLGTATPSPLADAVSHGVAASGAVASNQLTAPGEAPAEVRWAPRPLLSPGPAGPPPIADSVRADATPPASIERPPEPSPTAHSNQTDDARTPTPIDARRFFRPQGVAPTSAAMPTESSEPPPDGTPSASRSQNGQTGQEQNSDPTPLRRPSPWATSASAEQADAPLERPERPTSPAQPDVRDSSTLSPEELEREFKAALAKFAKS